jgi:hypothetical protein
VQLADLHAHIHAQRRVEVRERLVEQEHLGVAHDGAADGDALALAARELARAAVEQVFHLQDARGFGDLGLLLGLVALLIVSPKATFSRTVMCGKIA